MTRIRITTGLFAATALAVALPASAERPRKPLDPAARMAPLKPAVIDDTLVIGGEEIAARKVNSRSDCSLRIFANVL